MDETLFEALTVWTSTSYESLHEQGWTATLEESEEGDRLTLEMENRMFLGRFQLQDTGQVEIGVRDKRTDLPRRGRCEVYTQEQLEDAVHQFLEWMDQDRNSITKTDRVVCPHGKLGYESKGQALIALQHIVARRKLNNALQEYECHLCHQWHIGGASGRFGVKRRSFPKYTLPARKSPRRKRKGN